MCFFTASIFLSGCSSYNSYEKDDIVLQSLNQQALIINQQLPLNDKGITLVHASVKEHMLRLSMYESDGQQNLDHFLIRYATELCKQHTVKERIRDGAKYELSIQAKGNDNQKLKIVTCSEQ